MTRGAVHEVTGLTNPEFLEQHAAPGRVGLAGGSHWIDRAIRRAQKGLRSDGRASHWSHAFLFEGQRADGQHWILESDLEVHRRQVRLGVQENRATKYHDGAMYPNLAVLDFGLSPAQVRAVLTEALNLLAGNTRYSLRELAGTLLSLARPTLRSKENLLAREGALYCSALVQHCYEAVGIDFAPGVGTKNTTPEDVARTSVPHSAWVLRKR